MTLGSQWKKFDTEGVTEPDRIRKDEKEAEVGGRGVDD